MCPLTVSLLVLCLAHLPLAAPRHPHLPEDTYASPKYRVSFLNGLPLLNNTAQRWLRDGLRGGELEFLDQPWKEEDWKTTQSSPKEIGSSDSHGLFVNSATSQAPPHALEVMKLGHRYPYLCLIPPPLSTPQDEPDSEMTPVRSWSLLQPLSGTCLYHRQGWFTYSYCHNEEIRQFREQPHSHPHPPGGYEPQEDHDYASYTLGRAPPTPEPGADLSLAEQSALATNLELAREAGSRYLVQRWGDGSVCDKTGKHREVEVQFHCSMTMTDTIIFVKEAKTCSYVLVIHTPRLCGEPGFNSPLDSREEAIIRCREIIDSDANIHADQGSLPEADQPYRLPRRKPILPLGGAPAQKDADERLAEEEVLNAMIQRAVKALSDRGLNLQDGEIPSVNTDQFEDEGLVLIDIPLLDDLEGGVNALADALRAVGFDIKGERKSTSKVDDKNPQEEERADDGDSDGTQPIRDEL